MSSNTVAVFGSSTSQPGQPDFEDAVRLGEMLARSGHGVINGGYAGLMEAVSIGAARAGGTVAGVTVPALFPSRPGGNSSLSEEIPTATLTERIHELVQRSSAAIALPGSIGTLTELAVYWNDAYIAGLNGAPERPVVTVGRSWRKVVEYLISELDTRDDLVTMVDTVDEAHAFVDQHLAPK
ncbi:MAG TPA: DNA-binding protein [Actinobacteria bacterium]|nr:DNA-binding protein [Actinomycetota bacterium]